MSTVAFPHPAAAAAKMLEEPLRTKAIAVRLQLETWERELHIAQLQARIAVLEREILRLSLAPLEQQLLEALDAPAGATFNWQTLTYEVPG